MAMWYPSYYIHLKWRKSNLLFFLTVLLVFFLNITPAQAQVVITASIGGTTYADSLQPLANVLITAEHIPSGTKYVTLSSSRGRFLLTNLRTGGQYKVSAVAGGYTKEEKNIEEIGAKSYFDFNFNLVKPTVTLQEVTISGYSKNGLKSEPAAFSVTKEMINRIPNIDRSLRGVIRLSPFSYGMSIAGVNPRLNSFSIDGSLLITYGLGNTIVVGNATGTDPIALDAIEELQVNTVPSNVVESGFTGAGVNIITRKGDNQSRASIYDYFQTGRLSSSTKTGSNIVFTQHQYGFNASGSLKKDKLYYLFNFERTYRTEPATYYFANEDNGSVSKNTTRVLKKDLDALSDFLQKNYQYATGAYQNYPARSISNRMVAQTDWNIKNNSSLAIRLLYLNSSQDKLLDNTALVGYGARNNNLTAMSYASSNYKRITNALSVRVMYNNVFKRNFSHQSILSYSHLPEYRQPVGELKPLVDISQDNKNYISFGSSPFAQNNRLLTNIFQWQENFSKQFKSHALAAGATLNTIQISNTFTPFWQGYYHFNSLYDFYQSTPSGTVTPIGISSGNGRPLNFVKGYSLSQELPTFYPGYDEAGIYLQDDWQVNKRLSFNGGIRADWFSFPNRPLLNKDASSLSFQNKNGSNETVYTSAFIKNQLRVSPRVGFSLKLKEASSFLIKGGVGVYTGRLPLVLLGEPFRNSGMLVGTFSTNNTQDFPFVFSVDGYSNIQEQAGYDIVAFAPGFKYPQTLKNHLGLYYSSKGWNLSAELLYNKTLSAFYVRNANIDNRNFTTNNDGRISIVNNAINAPTIKNAFVVDNTTKGRQYGFNLTSWKYQSDKFYFLFSYTYGNAKDVSSFFGTEPASEFILRPVKGNPNIPKLGYSAFDQRHKFVSFASYSFQFTSHSKTSFSLAGEVAQNGRLSYTYSGNGDVNGDGVPGNDLIYIPANRSQINLVPYVDQDGISVTADMQWKWLDDFIKHSDYLNKHRGKIADRNGAILPFSYGVDAKIIHQFNWKTGNTQHQIAFNLDVSNILNLLNAQWGTIKVPVNAQPIEAVDKEHFRVYPKNSPREFTTLFNPSALWRLQLGIRYSMNKLLKN